MFVTKYFNPVYFIQPFFVGYPRIAQGKLSTDRTLPFDWLPRWFNGYYDEQSSLRKFLYAALYQSQLEFTQSFSGLDRLSFANSLTSDRYLYTLPAFRTNNYVPQLKIQTAIPSVAITDIQYVKTLESLLFEPVKPVWTFDNNNSIILKNLDITTYTVTSSGLLLDLSNAFFSDAPDEDSLIILEDAYGSYYYYSIKDLYNNSIPVAKDDTWLVHYRSSSLRYDLTQGNSFVSINNELINPQKINWKNNWDNLGEIIGVTRAVNETNINYLKRMYNYMNSNTYQEKVASLLNLSSAYLWDTSTTLSLTGSGCTYVSTPYLEKQTYHTDKAIISSASSFLIAIDNPTITSMTIDNKVYSSNYTINGNDVALSSNILANLTPERVLFDYRKDIYNKTYDNSNYISQLEPDNISRQTQTVILTTKIRCIASEKKPNEFYWNQSVQVSNGDAQFS